MAKDTAQRRVTTPLARLSYPAVVDTKPVMGDPSKKRYGAELLIEPSDLGNFKLITEDEGVKIVDIRSLCAEVAREEWGSDFDVETKKKVKTSEGGLGWPLKDGNAYAAKREADGKNGDAYKGKVYIRTKGSENFAPILKTVVPGERRFQMLDRVTDINIIRDYFTAGNYVLAQVTVKAVETPAKEKFITMYLNGVCYVKKGERLGSGTSMFDDQYSDELLSGISDLDPTEGMEAPIAL